MISIYSSYQTNSATIILRFRFGHYGLFKICHKIILIISNIQTHTHTNNWK